MSVLFTALGTLFSVSLRPYMLTSLSNPSEVSEAISVGQRVLEKVRDINPLTEQCYRYFTNLKRLVEVRADIHSSIKATGRGPSKSHSMYETESGESSLSGLAERNQTIGAELFERDWFDVSQITDIFSDRLLPNFDDEFFGFTTI